MAKQKAFLILVRPDSVEGLDELNLALGRGWRVVSSVALGGAATGTTQEHHYCVGCLVTVERDQHRAASLMESIEEEDAVDELLEGDGAESDVDLPS